MNILNNIINKEKEDLIYTAVVSSINPLQVKRYPDDDAIDVVVTSGASGMSVGSNVLMVKYLSKFIIIGVISNLNQHICILELQSVQSIANGTITKVAFGSGTTITDNFNMHSEVTNNTRITIKSAGYYKITVSGRYDDDSSPSRIIYLYKNNAVVEGLLAGHDGAGRFGGSYSTILNLAVDDYLEIATYQGSGGNLDLETANFSVVPL